MSREKKYHEMIIFTHFYIYMSNKIGIVFFLNINEEIFK
jgi:hypothetical protein